MSKLSDFIDKERPAYEIISLLHLSKSLIGSRYSVTTEVSPPAEWVSITSSSNPNLKAFVQVEPLIILFNHKVENGSVVYTPSLSFDLSRSSNLSDVEKMGIQKIVFDYFGLKESQIELPLNL